MGERKVLIVHLLPYRARWHFRFAGVQGPTPTLMARTIVMQVLNKYYPPDFDPELLPRNKKPRDKQVCTRLRGAVCARQRVLDCVRSAAGI